MSKGLIGCAVLLVLLGIGAIFALSRANDLFAWAMGRVENQLLANVSPAVPVDVRSDFRNAFAELVEGVRNGEVSTSHLQTMQKNLLEVARKGKGEVTEEDLIRLSRALRGEDPDAAAPEFSPRGEIPIENDLVPAPASG